MHADGGMCCKMFALSDVVMASSPAEITSQVSADIGNVL